MLKIDIITMIVKLNTLDLFGSTFHSRKGVNYFLFMMHE